MNSIIFQGSKRVRGEGCPAFSRGWGQFAIPTETYRTCDFPGGGGVWTSCPHSGSAHVIAVVGSKGQDEPAHIGYIHHLARAIAACIHKLEF